jgi:hypothetical protein
MMTLYPQAGPQAQKYDPARNDCYRRYTSSTDRKR